MGDDKISKNQAIDAALHLDGDPRKVEEFYDEWAHRYDIDTLDSKYIGPSVAANLFSDYQQHELGRADFSWEILDAGCGTGLVGSALSILGYENIDGFDLSDVMAQKARDTSFYREVRGGIDVMLAARNYARQRYDGVMSIGVFTLGHVPPEALEVLKGLLKPGGILLVSTRSHYYDQSNFQEVVDRLVAAGQLHLLNLIRNAPYTDDDDAHYWVFRS